MLTVVQSSIVLLRVRGLVHSPPAYIYYAVEAMQSYQVCNAHDFFQWMYYGGSGVALDVDYITCIDSYCTHEFQAWYTILSSAIMLSGSLPLSVAIVMAVVLASSLLMSKDMDVFRSPSILALRAQSQPRRALKLQLLRLLPLQGECVYKVEIDDSS